MKRACVGTSTPQAPAQAPRSGRRRHPRVALDLSGVYSLPSQGWRRWLLALFHPAGAGSVRAHAQIPCRVLNLGLGGARLALGPGRTLEDGQALLLGIKLKDGTLLETIEAEVLEVPESAGHETTARVLFHPMDPHIQVHLGRLINELNMSGASEGSEAKPAQDEP